MGAQRFEVPTLPLVGRSDELSRLYLALDRTKAGRGGAHFVSGPAGVGKSRLAQAVQREAERRDFLVATGSAYPIESGVPFAVFCDLLDPLLREESPETVAGWTRGVPEFQLLCPSIRDSGPIATSAPTGDIPDLRNRLLWNVPPFLDRMRRNRPLLLVLENLQWADPSSIELLHFLGRRVEGHGFLIVATYRNDPSDGSQAASRVVQALRQQAEIGESELAALAEEHVEEAVSGAFEAAPEVIRGFSHDLHGWTGGNPFFMRGTLESLVASGRLRREGGRWVGWELRDPALPTSIRDLVLQQVGTLSPAARQVAELAAAAGARVSLELLGEATQLGSHELLEGLRELQHRQILEGTKVDGRVLYSFVQPVVRSVVYAELGPGRSQLLHLTLARTLERMYGDGATDRADELAVHLVHAVGAADAMDAPAAARYLAVAGRRALAASAYREAARYLAAALSLLPAVPGETSPGPDLFRLRVDLAQARQELGEYEAAAELLVDARKLATDPVDPEKTARVDRLLGLNAFWGRRLQEALDHWGRGVEAAKQAADPLLEAQIRLHRSVCLQEIGRPGEAAEDATEALGIGEAEGAPGIRQEAHRALALLHTWTGSPDLAREHGESALALAAEADDDVARFSAHRAIAILEGLTGHPEVGLEHLNAAERIADRLGSPSLKLRLADPRIEYCARLGQWDYGIDVAEESIRMARDLHHEIALPRLLVWSGLLHLDRGDYDIAGAQIAEAWQLAGLAEDSAAPATHTAILAHIGRAALHLASDEFHEALKVAGDGMELVNRTGSRVWATHRLLPIMGEAALHLRDLDRARHVSTELRRESEALGHRIGVVWADACDALITWLEGDVEESAREMRQVADRLEALESVPYAARLRRQLAGRLADLGDRDGAIRELRRVHETLSTLGAQPELEKARDQFREVGARPPIRRSPAGSGPLTAREHEIARLVAQGKSNKAIGKDLGISHRTVGTHLSNIFAKLELGSRIQLGEQVRSGLLDHAP